MKHRIYSVLGSILFLTFALSACTEESSAPLFVNDNAGDKPASSSVSVDENLAKNASRKKFVYRVGPVDLPAHTSFDVNSTKPVTMKFKIDESVWMTGFVPKVVDANGNELPKELLHEAIVSNGHEENPFCAGQPNPIAIATSMLTETELPQGYGYPLLPSDPLETRVILVNDSDKYYSGVSFEFTIVAKVMNEFANFSDVKSMLIEPNPCDHKPLEVEPRAFTERSATYEVAEKGNLILAQGALQNFGSNISLSTGENSEPFWVADGVKDETQKLETLTANPFVDPDGPVLGAGDKITLSASYDNTSDVWLKGATAAALVYIAVE